MFNFVNRLFFTKFVLLFFVLLIFGIWEIDLNSEEVLVAFSFLFLIVLLALLLWASMNRSFVFLINKKYNSQLSVFFYGIRFLALQAYFFVNIWELVIALYNVTYWVILFLDKINSIVMNYSYISSQTISIIETRLCWMVIFFQVKQFKTRSIGYFLYSLTRSFKRLF